MNMNETTRKLYRSIVDSGPGGMLVRTGLTKGMNSLRDAGLITIELAVADKGPNGCGWYLVRSV